jgi:hypothetical protein
MLQRCIDEGLIGGEGFAVDTCCSSPDRRTAANGAFETPAPPRENAG